MDDSSFRTCPLCDAFLLGTVQPVGHDCTKTRLHAALIEAAEQARDEGMETAENAEDVRIILTVDAVIAAANATGERWSANDIRDQFPVTSAGLVGARVKAASMRKPTEMTRVGWVPSTLRSTHAKDVAVWVGVQAEVLADA